jgi:hypothetical protein
MTPMSLYLILAPSRTETVSQGPDAQNKAGILANLYLKKNLFNVLLIIKTINLNQVKLIIITLR